MTATQKDDRAAVVLVSLNEEDHHILGSLLHGSEWTIWKADTVDSCLELLRRNRIPVVICEHDSASGSWKDLLAEVLLLPQAPAFILMSRQANECLWGEALNLGAWDVLLKPLDAMEVTRILSSARRRAGGAVA